MTYNVSSGTLSLYTTTTYTHFGPYTVLLSISLPTVVFGNIGQVSYYFPAIHCHQ